MKIFCIKNLLFLSIVVSSLYSYSQTTNAKEETYTVVEKMPEFEGGQEGMVNFLKKNTVYPPKAREQGITGTVYVAFVVNKEGGVEDVKILRGVQYELDEEATRVVRLMSGKWTPGTQNGRNVKVMYNLPLKFSLPSPVLSQPNDTTQAK